MSKNCKCASCICGTLDSKDFIGWTESIGITLNPAQVMLYNHVMNSNRCIQYKCRRLAGFSFLYTLLAYWLVVKHDRLVAMIVPNHSGIKLIKQDLVRMGLDWPTNGFLIVPSNNIEIGLRGYGKLDYVFFDEASFCKNLEDAVQDLKRYTAGSADDTIVLYSSFAHPYLTYLQRMSSRWDSEWTFFQVPAFVFNMQHSNAMTPQQVGQPQYAMEMECKFDG